MLYTSMYIYAYVYVCYVSPAYSRCFISSLILMVIRSRKCSSSFNLHSHRSLTFSLSLSLSLSHHAQSVFSVWTCWLLNVSSLCVCFLHKILRTRRFYKTLPWNNVLYAVRGDRSRGKYHGIHFGKPSPLFYAAPKSLRDRYFQCVPPLRDSPRNIIYFILRSREYSVSPRSTLSTATLR